jgi:hypothetical protein
MVENQDFVLQLQNVVATPLPGDVFDVVLQTSRGDISCILHPSRVGTGGVIWAGGSGPGDLYLSLSEEFRRHGISSLRIRYRDDGNFAECAMDVLGAASFLTGSGVTDLALVGASFSGAVVIGAGAINDAVKGVVALCPQRYGTHLVEKISPRQLLLIHGTSDEVVPHAASKDIFARAQEPKELKLFPGAGHGLLEVKDELETLLRTWLVDLTGQENITKTQNVQVAPQSARREFTGAGGVSRVIEVIDADIATMESEALICPANDELIMQGGVATSISNAAGPDLQYELVGMGPVRLGDVLVTGAGRLQNKHVIHAVVASTVFGYRPVTEEAVAVATANSLTKASELGVKTLAIPALGGGGGGMHMERVARIMLGTVSENLQGETSLERVSFVLYGETAWRIFMAELSSMDLE